MNGDEQSAAIAKQLLKTNETVYDLVPEKQLLFAGTA